MYFFFFSSRRRHTRCALVTGVQTCALPISEEPWVGRFAATIAGRPNLHAILCGHIHRSVVAPWKGTTIAICSSTAPQLALDMRPMAPDAPDNRPMIVADPPAYALPRWTGNGLLTHFAPADDNEIECDTCR